MSRKAVTTLDAELNGGQVTAPYIYDCLTARMAENTGFQTFIVSRAGVAMTYGMADKDVATSDDMINASARIADFLPYPVITEMGNGFGETPYAVYHNVKRLRRMAGVSGVVIDDTTAAPDGKFVCEDVFVSKISAAVKACAGSGMKVIAATVCKEELGVAAAAKRLNRCREAGADLVCCKELKTMEECEAFAELAGGLKMLDAYPGADAKLDLEELARKGYGLVTVRYVEKASLYGLMQYGLKCRADNDTVYVDYHDFDGLLPELDHHIRLDRHWWEMEKMLKDLPDFAKGGEEL